MRHLAVAGKSGTGKTKLLELLIRGDLLNGHGLSVIDGSGELSTGVLRLVPEQRCDDVSVFDPTDELAPPSCDLLRASDGKAGAVDESLLPSLRDALSEIWNPAVERITRNALLVLARNSEAALEITRQAIEIGAKVVWMQLGVRNEEAARLAEEAGLIVVMNRCPKIEYGRLSGEIAWAGVHTRTLSSQRPILGPKGFQHLTIGKKAPGGPS